MTIDNKNTGIGNNNNDAAAEANGAAFALARVTMDVMVVVGFADGDIDQVEVRRALEDEIDSVTTYISDYDVDIIELKTPTDLMLEGGWDNNTSIYGDVDVKISEVYSVLRAREAAAKLAAKQRVLPGFGGDEG